MTDYISRDSALAFQCEVEPVMCKSVTTGKVFSATSDTALVKFLNALPAADVRENKRGEWIRIQDKLCECSECARYWIPFGDAYDFHYCPNCGADMRSKIVEDTTLGCGRCDRCRINETGTCRYGEENT